MEKLTSRKFLICLAAFLAAMATGIANAAVGNEVVASVGIACGILATAIYAACEASVDRARLYSDTTETQVITSQNHTVEAKSDDVITVASVLAPAPSEEQQPVMEDE